MAAWATYHLVNVGNTTDAEEDTGEFFSSSQLYFFTVFLNCISEMHFSTVFLNYAFSRLGHLPPCQCWKSDRCRRGNRRVAFWTVFLYCVSQLYFLTVFLNGFLTVFFNYAFFRLDHQPPCQYWKSVWGGRGERRVAFFSTIFLNCICQLYFVTVFLNCIS